MSIAPSWTDPRPDLLADARRAAADVGHLLAFRRSSVRRPRAARAALLTALALTVASAVVPAALPGSVRTAERIAALTDALPLALAGFVLLSVAAGIGSGGGRELLPREHAVAYPVSPTTDHLGALALAPLNIAWILQTWALLGTVAFVGGGSGGAAVVLAWVLAGTAAGQAAGWTAETVRRALPRGEWVVRGVLAAGAAAGGAVTATGHLDAVESALGLDRLADLVVTGAGTAAVVLLLAAAALVALGALPAHAAARLTPRDELRLESDVQAPRATPSSDRAMLRRIDRASVWRVVPMRRGLTVLAIGPGLTALVGGIAWADLVLLPCLVVSGAALLFGVNLWCLEGRGMLWRESLPVGPAAVWDARVLVLVECLLVPSGATLLLGALGAGVPTAAELVAILCGWAVASLQVLSACVRWSVRSPYAGNLRSARMTPAPPTVMVGYSARLALAVALVGTVFSGLAGTGSWLAPLLVAAPLLLVSTLRIRRARRAWCDPLARARVVAVVAG